jgi:hypothetical protein
VPPKDPARWRPTALHPPGYAGYLALVYRVFGWPLLPHAKAIQAVVDSRYPLSRAHEGWAKSMSGHATGKIIVDMVDG